MKCFCIRPPMLRSQVQVCHLNVQTDRKSRQLPRTSPDISSWFQICRKSCCKYGTLVASQNQTNRNENHFRRSQNKYSFGKSFLSLVISANDFLFRLIILLRERFSCARDFPNDPPSDGMCGTPLIYAYTPFYCILYTVYVCVGPPVVN